MLSVYAISLLATEALLRYCALAQLLSCGIMMMSNKLYNLMDVGFFQI